jgi:hypothetical protein
MLKYKICYYNLLQLNSVHIHTLKKEISIGRAPKTVNMYIQTLQTIWNIARSQWEITLPAQNPFALVTYNKIRNERDITLSDDEFKRLLEEATKSKLTLQIINEDFRFCSVKTFINLFESVLDTISS